MYTLAGDSIPSLKVGVCMGKGQDGSSLCYFFVIYISLGPFKV